ncbi:MAG TPA: class I SAM-dependent methyltransferase [Myxococcales bacterium]
MDVEQQALMLSNRLRKNFRKLRGRFEQQEIGVFRVYDWDIPEVRAAVDWYEGHLVVAEYARAQTDALPWLERMGAAAAEALEVEPAKVHLKKRRAGEKYERLARKGERIEVRERSLRFLVNLDDFIDTGLFADHRETRALVARDASAGTQAGARGKSFLNLFGYTGSFTCAAARGGAADSVTVDASQVYLDWARDHLKLNRIEGDHRLVRADVQEFLRDTKASFDLCVLDPPSRSDRGGFDVLRDHRALIEAALRVLRPSGLLWFATNHQRFVPQLEGLAFEELTARTVPEDFRGTPHRTFRIRKGEP